MKQGKTWIPLLFLLLLLLALAAGYGPRGQELEQFLVADVLAADRQSDGQVILTLLPQAQQGETPETYRGQGSSIEEAVRRLTDQTPLLPIYAQIRFLLIGDGFTAQEAAELTSILLQIMDLRLGTTVMQTDGQAAALLTPELGALLESSRLRREAQDTPVSTAVLLFRQYACGLPVTRTPIKEVSAS